MTLLKAINYIYHPPQSAQSFCDNVNKPAIQGYTCIDGKTFIIVFYGSNSIQDYLMNFNCIPTKCHGAWVHRGYLNHYNMIKVELMKRYRQSECTNVQTIGYSMGASIATLCAFMMYEYSIATHTIAFEPLRVGLPSFRQATQYQDIVHTTYGNDIVTKLLRCFGYKHAGKEIHFGGKKHWWKYSIKDHPLENIASELLYVKEGI